MKRFAVYHEMQSIIIDRKGSLPGSTLRFATLDGALSDPLFDNHDWVWLDIHGEGYLDEFTHPVDNVIYCIGSDFIGFDGKDLSTLPGAKLKLRQLPDQTGEWYAAMVAPIVAYDRFLYLQDRRK